jgi:ElaB/YqjD/DUF883 family membrane-anchored ribosome-binding protein
MGINHRGVHALEEGAKKSQDSGTSTGFENFKNNIADKLHHIAAALNEKAIDQDAPCGIAQYGKQAAEWLGQSAEHIRRFDYEHADTHVREYVRKSPGRSLLIAGAIGLFIGAFMRRR